MAGKKIGVLLAVGTLLGAGVGAAQAQANQNGWRSECVGNYQLDLPGEFDYALSDFRAMFEPADQEIGFYHSDGQRALFSSISLSGDAMAVTDAQPAGSFEKLEQVVDHRIKAAAAEKSTAEPARGVGSPVKVAGKGMFAWMNSAKVNLFMQNGGHIVNYAMAPRKGSMQKRVKRFAAQLRPRAHFDMPAAGSGLCIPHGLIEGQSGQSHRVAVTLRPKAYPDVEIYFKDESVGEPGRIKEDEYTEATADEAIRSFMTWRYSAYATRAAADWHGIHPVTLAGRAGKGVFMRILRKDGTRDYGYLAYVKGEDTAAGDKPNLMLYVFGNAARADGMPLNKEALRDIAKKVIASVKRRGPASR